MQRWSGLEEVPGQLESSAVAIGVFDGVHLGHRALIRRAVELAAPAGLVASVLTFDPNPAELLSTARGMEPPRRLCTVETRLDLFESLGVEQALVATFDAEFSSMSPEEFVVEVLVRLMRAKRVVVGENFRFGHRAAGDADELARLGGVHGFDVDVVGLVEHGDLSLSSTAIRALVHEGDLVAAAAALGRPHRLEGRVVQGDQRGRELGYPTANLHTTPLAAYPADGVYAGWLVTDPHGAATAMPSAISVGPNVTFDGTERRVEAYVLDRSDLELYGETVAIDFVERLRGMEKFDGMDALIAQMDADVAQTRRVLDV